MKNKDNKVCKGIKIPDCFGISPDCLKNKVTITGKEKIRCLIIKGNPKLPAKNEEY